MVAATEPVLVRRGDSAGASAGRGPQRAGRRPRGAAVVPHALRTDQEAAWGSSLRYHTGVCFRQ